MAAFVGETHDAQHYVSVFRTTAIVLGLVTLLSSLLLLRLPRPASA